MLSNKSINIIAKLNKKELRQFEKFLLSPFFNSNKKIIRLFRAIKKYYPAFSSDNFTKEIIYGSVYGGEKYSDTKFRKLFSDFYKLAEKFLVELNLENGKKIYNTLLLNELELKSIDNLFESKYKDALEYVTRSEFSVTDFLQLHDLKWQYSDYNISRGKQDKIADDIFRRSEYLIFYFLCDTFITINDIKANEATFNYKPTVNLPQIFLDNLNLKNIYKCIEENNFEHKEFFSLFYFAFMMNKDPKDNFYFFKLKKLFEENVKNLSRTFSMNFVILLTNYCFEKLKLSQSDELEAANEELCDIILKNKIYQVIDGYFVVLVFFNIFFVYLRNGHLQKSRNLLNDYSKFLHPSQVRDVQLLGESFILFEDKKYREALELISKIKAKLITIKIYMRKLILKLDYELNYFDSNKENLDNFRHFLKNNNQISELGKKVLMEFVELFNELVNIKKENFDDFKCRHLELRINKINDLFDRKWFQKKLKER